MLFPLKLTRLACNELNYYQQPQPRERDTRESRFVPFKFKIRVERSTCAAQKREKSVINVPAMLRNRRQLKAMHRHPEGTSGASRLALCKLIYTPKVSPLISH
jgi:hypothetical protein